MAQNYDNCLCVDRNDAQEALAVLKSARNIFFWLILLSLIVLGVCFWIVDRGTIDDTLGMGRDKGVWMNYPGQARSFDGWLLIDDEKLATAPAQPSEAVPAAPDEKKSEGLVPPPGKPFMTPPFLPRMEQQPTTPPRPRETVLVEGIKLVLPICRVTLAFGGVLYCLVLLVEVKIALVGHLGGLTPASKAFFLSLLLMVLLVPWQAAFCPNVPSAIFGYDELTQHYHSVNSEPSFIAALVYYTRFSGMWLFSLLILTAAQIRSCQSQRIIKKRLEKATPFARPLAPAPTPTPEQYEN